MNKGYYIFTLGCQYNYYDRERIALKLDSLGMLPSKEGVADLIVALACSVRQKPVDRLMGKIRNWQKSPRKPRIIVTACVLPADRRKIASLVDFLVPPEEFIKNTEKYLKVLGFKCKSSEMKKIFPLAEEKDGVYVTITAGCNNFCTFCAVPYTRGRETSRPAPDILREIESLTKKGVKKIVLLGQNVNSYGLSDWQPRDLRKNRDKTGRFWSKTRPSPFVKLLRKIEEIPSIEKISFLSPNPQDISLDLIDWLGSSPKFSGRLHLPLQSGSDKILARMNRRYSSKEYLELVRKIKQKLPDIVLSTDIMVGFPGETEADFKKTVELVKKIGFQKAFIAPYSPRPGTTATKLLKDDVPYKEKKRRFRILDQLINQKSIRRLADQTGKRVSFLRRSNKLDKVRT